MAVFCKKIYICEVAVAAKTGNTTAMDMFDLRYFLIRARKYR